MTSDKGRTGETPDRPSVEDVQKETDSGRAERSLKRSNLLMALRLAASKLLRRDKDKPPG
jgi:hypothetical protein